MATLNLDSTWRQSVVRFVVQARVRSSRLPGKILAPLGDQPLLSHVVRRLKSAAERLPQEADVLVATTSTSADDATEALCRRIGVDCFRGSEQDVLARYVDATSDLRATDVVVRATADNPLYCPRRAAAIVTEHLSGPFDYTCVSRLSYVVPEVMRVGALREMALRTVEPADREHVTPYFRRETGAFNVHRLPEGWLGLRPDIRLTVDTADELDRMAWIFDRLYGGRPLFALEQVYQLCDRSWADAA